MVNLIVEGVYIDLDPTFAYETKKAHPITNGLSNVYSTYSTDIQLPLTEVNVKVFDYSMLRKTTKVHKTLKGYLVKGTEIILVDVIVKKFTPKGITIYIIEKISDQLKDLLDGVYMLDEMNTEFKEKQLLQKNILNMTENEYFSYEPYNTEEKEFPSINVQELNDKIEAEFGLTINMPPSFNFRVFANKAKFGSVKNVTSFADYNGALFPSLHAIPRDGRAFCVNNLFEGSSFDVVASNPAISVTTEETWKIKFSG